MMYRGTLTIEGGLDDGDSFPTSLVLMSGDVAAFTQFDPVAGRNVMRDRMTRAQVVVDEKYATFTGVSDQLVSEVGLEPGEATVEWRLELKGCQACL